ncbi:siderophore-interacting protein [Corynebacterium sp. 35RC1]|nr:siderophore-interacting protein [Corynebacterium sp. 35RC1]
MYLPMLAEVREVETLSPHLVRVVFGGEALQQCTPADPVFDQRIKFIFGLDPHTDLGADWYAGWQELGQGVMRTYTIREVSWRNGEQQIAVDFVLHPGGPAAQWAQEVAVGDELLFVGPTIPGDWGVDFLPGAARNVVLAGDETALPAIASILSGLGEEFSGRAFIEVPTAQDVLSDVRHPNFEVRWLAREGAAHGELLTQEMLGESVEVGDEPETLVWETPTFSTEGAELEDRDPNAQMYYWIAGESKMVTGIRRVLVREREVPRSQVSFMGYWRQGRAS